MLPKGVEVRQATDDELKSFDRLRRARAADPNWGKNVDFMITSVLEGLEVGTGGVTVSLREGTSPIRTAMIRSSIEIGAALRGKRIEVSGAEDGDGRTSLVIRRRD